MSILVTSISAVLPYLVYLCIGHYAHRFHLMDDSFFQTAQYIVIPCVLSDYNVCQYIYDLFFFCSQPIFSVICDNAAGGGVLVSMLFVPYFIKDNRRRGAVVHCLYRSNIVLFAMGLTGTLYGSEALAAASLVVAIFVPLYNVAAVMILEYYRGGKIDFSVFKSIVRNPLLIGAVSGVLFSLLPVKMPVTIADILSDLSGVTTPLAMMVLGATLSLSALNHDRKCVTCTVVVKMVVIPLCALVLAKALGFSSLEVFLSFIVFATPVAANAYTMSENMGADGTLAGEIVAGSTVVSIGTLFLWIVLLQNVGII